MITNLREKLKDIWTNKISKHYSEGLICSERNLQAEFYYQLRMELDQEENAVVWIEPTLSFEKQVAGLSKLKPDLLITKDKEIICVIELKYKPYGEVFYEADLKKLFEFCRVANNGLRLKTDVKTGNYCDEFYYVSVEILTCFAVVCNEVAHAAKKEEWKSINFPKNFLHLTGIFDRNVCETIFS